MAYYEHIRRTERKQITNKITIYYKLENETDNKQNSSNKYCYYYYYYIYNNNNNLFVESPYKYTNSGYPPAPINHRLVHVINKCERLRTMHYK